MPVTFLTDTELFNVLDSSDYSTDYIIAATEEMSKRVAFIKLQEGLNGNH